MENQPIIKELNTKVTLSIPHNGLTEITLIRLIKRPILKRIVFISKEIDRVIIYKDSDYDLHVNDTDEQLIEQLVNINLNEWIL